MLAAGLANPGALFDRLCAQQPLQANEGQLSKAGTCWSSSRLLLQKDSKAAHQHMHLKHVKNTKASNRT
jgi:hypothetical protein